MGILRLIDKFVEPLGRTPYLAFSAPFAKYFLSPATNRVHHPQTIQYITMASTTDELYQHFVASTAGNSRAQRELRRFLSSADKLPEQESTLHLLPIDDMELRLQHIRHLEDYWRKNFTYLTLQPQNQYRPFNDFEVSSLLQMDLNFLRLCNEEVTIRDGVLRLIKVLPAVLKICRSSSSHR